MDLAQFAVYASAVSLSCALAGAYLFLRSLQ